MSLQFEGHLEGVNESVIEACEQFLVQNSVQNAKVSVEEVGKKGDNFIAQMKRFIVKNKEIDFQMIVKIAPTDEMARIMVQIEKQFSNESLMYNKLLTTFTKLEDSAGIPTNERFRAPSCYGVHLEAPYECIAMEDLNQCGFTMRDRLASLTDGEVKVALTNLAKYHALGFVVKENESSVFEELKNKLFNLLTHYLDAFAVFSKFLDAQIDVAVHEEDVNKRVKNIISSFGTTIKTITDRDMSSKYSTIIHGDCWTNNFMFKMENGNPVEAAMLDYQLVRISSPVLDLEYFILNCTDVQTRQGRYHAWINHYYENFTDYLKKFNLKSNVLYPRDQFDADLFYYSEIVLVLSIFSICMNVRESEEAMDIKEYAVDLTNLEEIEKNFEKLAVNNTTEATVERFKGKLRGVIEDMMSYGYLSTDKP